MNLLRWCSLVLLLLVFSCADSPTIFAQASAPPQTMNMCFTVNVKECETLTWTGEFYEGREAGSTVIATRYWVNEWTADHIDLTVKSRKLGDGVFPLDGKIVASRREGSGITGVMKWQIGYNKFGQANFDLQLPKSNPQEAAKASATGKGFDISVSMPSHRSKTNHDILLPAGSSEVYVTYPADVRALLRPEYTLNMDDAKLGCNEVNSVTNGPFALEVGRFALRNGDYARGKCWVSRASNLGSQHAKALLGVIYLMGWAGPKDPSKAFNLFYESYRARDFWGGHFLEKCFDEGIGTPINKVSAQQISTSEVNIDKAAEYEQLIGDDDLDQRQKLEIAEIEGDPPKKLLSCDTQTSYQKAHNIKPECSYAIDQVKVNELEEEINEKYANIK